jgi:PAS domain S-box-containing protein
MPKLKNILVVDDEADARQVLVEFLNSEGYQVKAASDGMQAVQMLKDNLPVDLVITDLNMPVISGLDVIDILAKQFPTVQIIVITGFGTMDTVLQALRCGAVDFLQKPFLLEVLKSSLQKAEARFQMLTGDMPSPESPVSSPGVRLASWGMAVSFDATGEITDATAALRELIGSTNSNLFTSLTPLESDWQTLLQTDEKGALVVKTTEGDRSELHFSYHYHPEDDLYSAWITPMEETVQSRSFQNESSDAENHSERKLLLNITSDYQIRFISPPAARLIGLKSASILERPLSEILGAESESLMAIDIESQLNETLHASITFPDGYSFWADVVFRKSEDGETYTCELTDVSYRKNLEAEIERQRNELTFTRQKLSMIVDTTSLMKQEATKHDKLKVIAEKIVQSHSFQRAVILLLDGNELRETYHAGFTDKSLGELLQCIDLNQLLKVTAESDDQTEAFVIHDNNGLCKLNSLAWSDSHHLILPVRQQDKTTGIILLDKPLDHQLPDAVVIDLLSLFAAQIAAYLEEVELRQELQMNEQNYRNLFDNSRLAILLADTKDGRIIDVNRQTLELFGYEREQMLAMYTWDLRPESYREEAMRNFREAVKRGYGQYDNIPIRQSGGNEIVVEYDALVTQFRGQQVLQSYYRDITERQLMEFSVIQSQKLAGLGQLSAGVAHELRNPLGIINSSLYYINSCVKRDEQGFTDSIRKHLAIIKSEVERSRRIIENLLSFSRISKAEVEPVHINELMKNTLDLVQKELLVNDITLETDLAPISPQMLNLDQLKQAFLNIILNATQAMPSGGILRVDTAIEEELVVIRFSDTGVGIPKEQLSDVLNPFYTTKSPGEGTGLGLSLTHSIIQRTGGSLHIGSEQGKGTIVTVKIPIKN